MNHCWVNPKFCGQYFCNSPQNMFMIVDCKAMFGHEAELYVAA